MESRGRADPPSSLPGKPKEKNFLIDLGAGVIRVRHAWPKTTGVFPNVTWERVTTITVLMPGEQAMSVGDASIGPRSAASIVAELDEQKVSELMAALALTERAGEA